MAIRKRTGFLGIALYAMAMNFSIRWLAASAITGPASLPIWVVAAVVFMVPLVIATLELSSRFPEEGGLYAWTRETQGPFAGFMCGWFYWASNLPYFASLWYFIINLFSRALMAMAWSAPLGHVLADTTGAFVATSLLTVVIALMHSRGLGVGKLLPAFGATMSIFILIFLIATGLYLTGHHGSATDFAKADYAPPFNANGAILWSNMLFAYAGIEGVALMRNEVEGGVRTIIKALFTLGTLQITGYIIGTAAMLMIIPQAQATRLSGLPEAIGIALSQLHVEWAHPLFLLIIGTSLLGGLSAWFGAAARLPFAVGVDRMLPAAVGRLDPKTGAPVVAIWLQAVLTIALLGLSAFGASLAGAYDFVVAMSALTVMIPYVWMFAAYWIAQKRDGAGLDFRTPGGAPWARIWAVVGILAVFSAMAGSLVPSPDEPHKMLAFVKLIAASAVMTVLGGLIDGVHLIRGRKA